MFDVYFQKLKDLLGTIEISLKILSINEANRIFQLLAFFHKECLTYVYYH